MGPAALRSAQDERARLERFVGQVVVNSESPRRSVSIDGRSRGTTPLASPLRTGVGTRVVRVTKAGWAPFETTLRVASAETSVVQAHLSIVSELGHLHVEEARGAAFEVRVDGAPVGTTPWDGEVSAGEHSVALHGSNHRGVTPQPVVVEAESRGAPVPGGERASGLGARRADARGREGERGWRGGGSRYVVG